MRRQGMRRLSPPANGWPRAALELEGGQQLWRCKNGSRVGAVLWPRTDLRQLMVNQREVIIDRAVQVEDLGAVSADLAPARVDELIRQVWLEDEEVGICIVPRLVLPHHRLAQAMALALGAAVLEGGVHHEAFHTRAGQAPG